MPKSIQRLLRPGGVANLALGLIALGVFIAAGILAVPRMGAAARPSVPPTAHEVAVSMSRVGLDATTLTAAGLSANQVTAVVADAKVFLAENMDDLRAADQEWAEAKREADRLEALIQAGGGSAQHVQDLAAARSTLTTKAAARQAVLDNLFSAGTADLGAGAIATINTMRANRAAGWDVPDQYLTLTRTEPEWVQLRDALTNVRISTSLGEQPDGACAQLVTTCNSAAGVASAKASLDANLAANTTAWNSAVNG